MGKETEQAVRVLRFVFSMVKEGGKDMQEQQQGLVAKDYTDPPPNPMVDINEFKRALIAEFIATFLFLYITKFPQS